MRLEEGLSGTVLKKTTGKGDISGSDKNEGISWKSEIMTLAKICRIIIYIALTGHLLSPGKPSSAGSGKSFEPNNS